MTSNHTYESRKQLIHDKHDVSMIQAGRLLFRMVGVPDTRSVFRRKFCHLLLIIYVAYAVWITDQSCRSTELLDCAVFEGFIFVER
jgi:hypothetical protein